MYNSSSHKSLFYQFRTLNIYIYDQTVKVSYLSLTVKLLYKYISFNKIDLEIETKEEQPYTDNYRAGCGSIMKVAQHRESYEKIWLG